MASIICRKTNVVSLNSGSALTRHSYGFDAASRMNSAVDNTGGTAYSATYSYLANSPLISQIMMKSGSTTRLTVNNQFDRLNRLLSISNAPSAASPVVLSYQLNDAN